VSEELPPDQDVWDYDLPKNQQLNQESLSFIDNRIKDQDIAFGTVEGLVIIRNDQLVFENYYTRGSNRFSQKNIGSMGLMITMAALGIAIDQRLLSVDDSIYHYLPEYSSIFQDDPSKKAIKIMDILTHQTGLSWNESIERNPAEDDLEIMKSQDDWVRYVLSKTLVGIGFYSFNTANGVLLAKIIENAAGVDFN